MCSHGTSSSSQNRPNSAKLIALDDALGLLSANDPVKAKAYYERLLFEQTGSIFVPEARDRFRKLRGDKLEPPPEPLAPTPQP